MADKIRISTEELEAQAAALKNLVVDMDSIEAAFAMASFSVRQGISGKCDPYNLGSRLAPIQEQLKNFRIRMQQAANLAGEAAQKFTNVDRTLRNNADSLNYELPGEYKTDEVKNSPPSGQTVTSASGQPAPSGQPAGQPANTARTAKINQLKSDPNSELHQDAPWDGNKTTYKGEDMWGQGCFAAATAFQIEVDGMRGTTLYEAGKNPNNITSGDVLHYYKLKDGHRVVVGYFDDGSPIYDQHWIYVYDVQGHTLFYGEGNFDSHVNYGSTDRSNFQNGTWELNDIRRIQ